MEREAEVLLALIRTAVNGTATSGAENAPVPFSGEVDWAGVSALSVRQGVAAMAADGLQLLCDAHPDWEWTLDSPENETVKYDWFGQIFYAEECYAKYSRAIASLAQFYREHGFRMMILKGYACGLNYPVPAHRPYGDIDIWLFGQYREADRALARERGVKIDNSHHHHTVFRWKGEMVENHYDIINIYHHRSSRELEALLKRLAGDDSHLIEVEGQPVCIPSPDLHALFLLRHAASHFAATDISLRHLLDWGFLVKACGDRIDWAWLSATAERFGMREIFRCFNAICAEDLGLSPDLFPADERHSPYKERVLNDILRPEFDGEAPKRLLPRIVFKYRRWRANGWKHRLCYRESMASALWSGIWLHLRKPSSI